MLDRTERLGSSTQFVKRFWSHLPQNALPGASCISPLRTASCASWFVISVFLLSSSHAPFVRVLRLGPRPSHFQMRLDSGVLLGQTESGLVNLAPGRPRPQPRERPGLRVVLTGPQDRARERERARDSDAPGKAVLSARRRLRGVGLRHIRPLIMIMP